LLVAPWLPLHSRLLQLWEQTLKTQTPRTTPAQVLVLLQQLLLTCLD
jgi:hypothetical protein